MSAPIDFDIARALAKQLGVPRPSRALRCRGAREVLAAGEAAMYEPLRRDLERVSRATGVSREQLLALAAAGRKWPEAPPLAKPYSDAKAVKVSAAAIDEALALTGAATFDAAVRELLAIARVRR